MRSSNEWTAPTAMIVSLSGIARYPPPRERLCHRRRRRKRLRDDELGFKLYTTLIFEFGDQSIQCVRIKALNPFQPCIWLKRNVRIAQYAPQRADHACGG